MKRIHLITVAGVILIALIFAYSQSPQIGPQTRPTAAAQRFTIEREVSTQQRVNRFFHGDVMPKLKNCWSNVKGKGRISLKYTYTKTRGRWFLSRLETQRSTLPTGQDAVAQKCMLEAVRSSSFAVEADESTQNTFVLNWTWPVPFPANAALLTRSMFAAKPTSGGYGNLGCDGDGAAKSCETCSGTTPSTCIKVCVGYSSCDDRSSNDSCKMQGKCASGGPFGVGGGTTIF
ncbi:MAG TPA: hypothetical protein VGQ39_21705 [Pyrinomonadaceae bacterium]|nr:hypothetical protein [Pyrinomonadaceae bacterium]